jgi:hypothetical protein
MESRNKFKQAHLQINVTVGSRLTPFNLNYYVYKSRVAMCTNLILNKLKIENALLEVVASQIGPYLFLSRG